MEKQIYRILTLKNASVRLWIESFNSGNLEIKWLARHPGA